jgi:hypothetical protein
MVTEESGIPDTIERRAGGQHSCVMLILLYEGSL